MVGAALTSLSQGDWSVFALFEIEDHGAGSWGIYLNLKKLRLIKISRLLHHASELLHFRDDCTGICPRSANMPVFDAAKSLKSPMNTRRLRLFGYARNVAARWHIWDTNSVRQSRRICENGRG